MYTGYCGNVFMDLVKCIVYCASDGLLSYYIYVLMNIIGSYSTYICTVLNNVLYNNGLLYRY